MNSTPPTVSVVVSVFAVLVTAGRWWLVDDAPADRLINRALSWNVASLAGYSIAAAVGSEQLGQRVLLGIGAASLSHAYGLAKLLDGASPAAVGARQRRYNAAAGVYALITAGCTVADALGAGLGSVLDWEGLLWSAAGVFIGFVGLLLARACIRELRLVASSLRERLTYSALLLVGLYCAVSTVGGITQVAAGAVPGDPGPAWAAASIVAFGVLAALVSIPLLEALVLRAGLDRDARACRRLRPLWRDLTTAVPEVVLHPHDSGSASRLYRMSVEIEDALVVLRNHTPASGRHPADDGRNAVRAAYAAWLERYGPIGPSARGDDHADRLRFLLDLARRWPCRRPAFDGYIG
ncbi:DUF6545 domain-containing protein [Nocardia beijingensis]|uniref:DUF6545 domain-containing protein n=1 Tax=Nocardia beijingensis TaxID=95162 RepID=UPI0033E38F05